MNSLIVKHILFLILIRIPLSVFPALPAKDAESHKTALMSLYIQAKQNPKVTLPRLDSLEKTKTYSKEHIDFFRSCSYHALSKYYMAMYYEILTEMTSDPFLTEAVAKGKVSVLAVYTEGNEEAWRKALPDMPEGWMVATDRQMVKDHALYDLKAMPSLYLLDGKKKVILKDAPYARIKERLAGEFV